jgi:hypothetical protein
MSDSTNPTRRRLLLGLGVAATASLAGCGATADTDDTTTTAETDAGTATPTATPTPTETPPDGNAALRVAHFSPNAPNVDVYVDDTAVLEDVPFGAVSTYMTVPAGTRRVRITPAGDAETIVFEGDVGVANEATYTVAAVGEVGDGVDRPFAPLVLEDDVSEPDDGTARIRVIHASPDAPAVDVSVVGSEDPLFDGVDFGQSGSIAVPAGDYTVEIRGDTESNDGDVVASFDVSLAAGGVYSAFASGYLSPGDSMENAFDLFVAQDVGETMDEDPAALRVGHLSPNAPNVDVYVNDAAVLEDVPFGAVSSYLTLPAGAHQVTITAAGDAETVVFDQEVTVEAGAAYSAIAVGELGDSVDRPFEVLLLTDDTTVPDGDTATLRLLHASPDAPAVDVTVESNGAVLYDGVAFGEFGSVSVPAGAYTVEIRGDTESNDGDVVTTFDVDLAGGTAYTAIAGGYLAPTEGSDEPAFDLFVAVDAEGNE